MGYISDHSSDLTMKTAAHRRCSASDFVDILEPISLYTATHVVHMHVS